MSEIIRAGIDAIDKGQMEAAKSLGMTYRLAMQRIVLPQAARVIVPPLGNEFNNMLKTTSLLFFIGVYELFADAEVHYSATFKPSETSLPSRSGTSSSPRLEPDSGSDRAEAWRFGARRGALVWDRLGPDRGERPPHRLSGTQREARRGLGTLDRPPADGGRDGVPALQPLPAQVGSRET